MPVLPPPEASHDLCPLPLPLGVTRTPSGRLRKFGDPAGPGKWLLGLGPFVWGSSDPSQAQMGSAWAGQGGQVGRRGSCLPASAPG